MKATLIVLVLGVLIVFAVLVQGFPTKPDPKDFPWEKMPTARFHTDHTSLIKGPFENGPAVTKRCLECHDKEAHEVIATTHWTWAGHKIHIPGKEKVQHVGKLNLINNFCMAALPNIEGCSSCHAGYGWKDSTFDFKNQNNVDCLICHEQSGAYQKGPGGYPKKGVDLVRAAQSVGRPTRRNCGDCHFKGGGGDAVKHGDMDASMFYPGERVDVHIGRHQFQCVDCHRTQKHVIPGCAMSVCEDRPERVKCTDCHSLTPHHNERINLHTSTVACQTCHIPRMAIDAATKTYWDWSTAGRDDIPEHPHSYLKKKGSFQFAQNVRPEYYWYNLKGYRLMPWQKINPSKLVVINHPRGGPGDPQSKIWPFKTHKGKQPFDKKHLHLLTPKTYGPGGFWTEFNWDKALRLGAETTGVAFSGDYGFVETIMFWSLSHMVQRKEKSLQCADCHGEGGIMDWKALGFEGDPAYGGKKLDIKEMLSFDKEGGQEK